MRFLSVRADSFEPFPPTETLHLTPGLNIVYGPNEAGKSSWHAALYPGLCGIRRGQGRHSVEDQAFAERHRPWTNDESADWVVTSVLVLQDGRQLELCHDLGTRTAVLADPLTR
ncbi:MAG: AAA family ATPase, partial [Dehalococcoidia bacterium]|nr:AAA family ATPase [Dehalococcoidia bacterium]